MPSTARKEEQPSVGKSGSVMCLFARRAVVLTAMVCFSVSNAFSVDPEPPQLKVIPEQVDRSIEHADQKLTVTLLNVTSAALQGISVSSLGFSDGKGAEPIRFTTQKLPDLPPGKQLDVHIDLPAVRRAGVFSGALRFEVNGQTRATLPLTLRSRGPRPEGWRDSAPLLFFLSIVMVGWLASAGLDQWYTRDFPRVESVLALREASSALEILQEKFEAWQHQHNAQVRQNETQLVFDRAELETVLKTEHGKPVAELQAAAKRFDLLCQQYVAFWTALQVATARFDPAQLPEASAKLDEVPRPEDIAVYRDALLRVLRTPIGGTTPPSFTSAQEPSLRGTLLNVSSADLYSKARSMDLLRAVIVGILVVISAFTVYYLPNPIFGSAQDYIAVFLWTFGLTQTGSQLVASVRKS